MKRLLFISCIVIILVSCQKSTPAEEYVRQKLHEAGKIDSDIKSIKEIETDSLMNCFVINACHYNANCAVNDYSCGKISKQEVDEALNGYLYSIADLERSWTFNIGNDKQYKREYSSDDFSVVKIVEITYNSGERITIRVQMNRNNNDIPKWTEGEVKKYIQEELSNYQQLDINNRLLE